MSTTLPKLRELQPADSGGTIARSGFAFQDHVAARFCIEMLANAKLREVWCETYDDIVLVWDQAGQEEFEFVQVKAEKPDQLWTAATLCKRDKQKGKPEKVGSSIAERSLARDCCSEDVTFRLVTSWELHSEIRILKLPRDNKGREIGGADFKALSQLVKTKVGDYKSPKGNGCEWWAQRVLWEIDSEQNLEKVNCLSLLKVLEKMGSPVATDSASIVYNALLALVKGAAEKPDTEREKKFLKADEVYAFVKRHAEPFPGLGPSEILDKKLTDATLPDTERETAQDLRRAYLLSIRTRSYLETSGPPSYATAVLHQLLNLRTERDSGQLPPMDGVQFHALCLRQINAAMSKSGSAADTVPVELGAGCMYEITSRCRHRFTRATE